MKNKLKIFNHLKVLNNHTEYTASNLMYYNISGYVSGAWINKDLEE